MSAKAEVAVLREVKLFCLLLFFPFETADGIEIWEMREYQTPMNRP